MTPEAKELLKSIGKLIGYVATDFVDMVTCVPRDLLENHIEKQVQKKIIERQLPHLGKRPGKYQRWTEVTLGISEKEVGELLGLPDGIEGIAKDGIEYPGDPMLWCYARGRGARGGNVYFKNKKVVGFMFAGKDRLTCNFTNKGLSWQECIASKIELSNSINYYSNAEGLRKCVRIAYDTSFRIIVKSGIPPSSDMVRHLALFDAFKRSYSASGTSIEENHERLIWAELLPFLYLDEDTAREALAEYIVYKAMPVDAKISWLEGVVQRGYKLAKNSKDKKAYSSWMPVAKAIEAVWLLLLEGQGVKQNG